MTNDSSLDEDSPKLSETGKMGHLQLNHFTLTFYGNFKL